MNKLGIGVTLFVMATILIVGLCSGCVRTSLVFINGNYSGLPGKVTGGQIIKMTDNSKDAIGFKTKYTLNLVGKDVNITKETEPIK